MSKGKSMAGFRALMQHAAFGMLAALLATACKAPETIETYSNPGIGLSLDYSSAWSVVSQEKLQKAVAAGGAQGLDTEGVDEALPLIVFGISRVLTGAENNSAPNLMVMVVPMAPEECRAIDTDQWVAEDAQAYAAGNANGRLVPGRHVQPATGLRGYTVQFTSAGREVTQNRYFFCSDGKYVLVQGTSTTPAAYEVLAQVIGTVRVARD